MEATYEIYDKLQGINELNNRYQRGKHILVCKQGNQNRVVDWNIITQTGSLDLVFMSHDYLKKKNFKLYELVFS
jgi:hypothetical protein